MSDIRDTYPQICIGNFFREHVDQAVVIDEKCDRLTAWTESEFLAVDSKLKCPLS